MKKPAIVLKLDFQKAFNIVHWGAITTARGFPSGWTWWIQHLLTTSQAHLLINGRIGSKIKMKNEKMVIHHFLGKACALYYLNGR